MRPRLRILLPTILATAVMIASGVGSAASGDGWTGETKDLLTDDRAETPEDRYAMAGGCYVAKPKGGDWIARTDGGFSASAVRNEAEPFRFQATRLGSYLLFGTAEDFLAASEGAVGEVLDAVTESQLGNMAGGLALEQTDMLAEDIKSSPANQGRGDSVVAASEPSELADWDIEETQGGFALTLPSTSQALGADDGELVLVPEGEGAAFQLELAEGCATYPEIEINVDGPIVGGEHPYQEVRGYMDLHLHMMAFEFLGGRARCGRPWHPYGVKYALVDCQDHEPGGHGAALEAVLLGGNPGEHMAAGHNTDGWPTFEGWPRYNSLTHEQVYYKWLERAWRGGLRMFTNLLVDNNQLCKIYPLKRNSCNEMDGVRLQHQRIYELQDYIDAQNGGPGEGWFRIVTDPFEAREVINDGKLAVVLGIEVSVPLDCGLTLDTPRCDTSQIDQQLDEVYDLGVRQMELVNKFDNALSGVAGDSGSTGVVVNSGNRLETGRYWQMDTCEDVDVHEHGDHSHEGHAHDRTQMNFHDDGGMPEEFTGRDALAGGILGLAGQSGAAPVYPQGPHCNVRGLSELGEHMIRGMAERGMIFDPDHMSAKAQAEAMDLIDELRHSGVVSSHGWSNETIYPRIYEAGGVITPYAGGSTGFVGNWAQHRKWADDRFYWGFGYGADTNGFGSQGGPRGRNADDPVTYPFGGFGGVVIDQQHSGDREYDVNLDGVAHYGLYPDWIEDLRRLAGQEIIDDMVRGPEAYLQMWERSIGVPFDACRSDVDDLTDEAVASLQLGMTSVEVLWAIGQPSTRTGSSFEHCMTDGRTLTLTFDNDGLLIDKVVSAG